MRIDVNTFIGGFPFRAVPHPDADVLVRVLEREQIGSAWVGHLPGAFHRDPQDSNAELYQRLAPFRDVLHPVPTVRPDWPNLVAQLQVATDHGAPAVRVYPQHLGLAPGALELSELAEQVAERRLAILLTIRFEDLRQRHTLDAASELSAAHVRELARVRTGAKIVVTAAGRELIEEVHWGLTPEEQATVFYDISWLWGPPTDDLSHLFRTIGPGRFLYGSMWPLRLVQAPRANLALLEPDQASPTLADPSTWR